MNAVVCSRCRENHKFEHFSWSCIWTITIPDSANHITVFCRCRWRCRRPCFSSLMIGSLKGHRHAVLPHFRLLKYVSTSVATQKWGWSLFIEDWITAQRPFAALCSCGWQGWRLRFENFSVNFSKYWCTFLWQNQKCAMDYSLCKELIDVLGLNFKAMCGLE